MNKQHNLLLETAEVMVQFRQSAHQIVQNLEDKLDKSLYDQRKMITEMVRAEVTKEMSNSVAGYVRDMEKARNQMANQVREFNVYLNKVNEEKSEDFFAFGMDYFACNGNIGYWRIGIIFLLYNVD